MKYTFFFSSVFCFSLACQEETKDDTSTDTTFEITNVEVSSAPCDGEMPPADEVSVTSSNGTATVTHSNYEDSSCLGFTVSGDLEGSTLTLTYTETGEPCDCISMYALNYDIIGLASGTYTLEFPGNVTENLTIE